MGRISPESVASNLILDDSAVSLPTVARDISARWRCECSGIDEQCRVGKSSCLEARQGENDSPILPIIVATYIEALLKRSIGDFGSAFSMPRSILPSLSTVARSG
jgi:hypothetical protein